jgi:3-hydroxybutyryl-CoA dehydrogenase
MPDIKKVGVLGGGLMGSGIAQVAAQSGFTTVVREVTEALGQKAKGGIEKTLAKGIEKGKVTTQDRDACLGRLSFTTDVASLKDCDIIIEAVIEDLEVKNALWKELNALCPAHTIFASNTSSLTIAAMAATSGRPDRIVGLHFFNPVPMM